MHARRRIIAGILSMLLLVLAVSAGLSLAQGPDENEPAGTQATIGTGFTYQGRLTDSSANVIDDTCDVRFSLWDAGGTGGNQIGSDHTVPNVEVSGGRFTAQVNTGNEFQSNAFSGDARWLQIEVKCSGDSSFQLIGRQRLRPAPYARFAPQAGSAPWSGLSGVPGDIADGDDDTTYSAGSGLILSGTTFSLDAGSVQTRVDEGCAVGSTIRAINADGSVECTSDAPLHRSQPPTDHVTSTVDTDGWAGSDTAATIGADGLPLIAEYVSTGGSDLRVAHCDDLDCAASTVTTIDSTDDVGDELAVTLGTDGLPLISYRDATNDDLKVAHCNNPACTGATTTTLDDSGNVGRWTSITIGADGLGLISYYDEGNGNLKVAHCDNITCTTASHTTAIDTGTDVGEYSSIALGVDGRGLISYYDRSNGDLKVAHCDNTTCSSASTATVASTGDVGQYTSLTIGSDGLGVIAYWDSTNQQLSAAHCDSISCTSPTISPLSATGNAASDSISIAVGADGLPVISYNDATLGALGVAHCTNKACDSATTTIVDDSSTITGHNTSMTVGVDGLPFVSYFDNTNKRLMTAHCSNAFCASNFRRR